MSEVEDKVRGRDTQESFSQEIVKKSLVRMFEEKFQELAPICRDRIVTLNDDVICTYHESSPTDCRFSICPRLKPPLDADAGHLEKTEGRRNRE